MFLDHFDNGVVDLLNFPSSGTVTEAGSQLTLAVPDATEANITQSATGAIVAYAHPRGALLASKINGPVRIDAKLDQFSNIGNTGAISGLLAWKGDIADLWSTAYGYEFGYYIAEGQIIISRWLGSWSGIRVASSGAKTKPDGASNKHIYRILINPLGSSVRLTDDGFVGGAGYMYPNSIGFAYSTDAGTTWTWWHQRTVEFQVDWVGMYLRSWAPAAGRSYQSIFDYFTVLTYDWDSKQHFYFPNTSGVIDSLEERDKQTMAAMRTDANLDTTGQQGHTGFEYPSNRGMYVPGPQLMDLEPSHDPASLEDGVRFMGIPGGEVGFTQQPGPIAPWKPDDRINEGEFEDAVESRSQGGLEPWFSFPETMGPFSFREGVGSQVAGLEDELFLDLDGADYEDEKLDADGNELLYDAGVEQAVLIRTDEGSFGDPTNNNHWGAARDGYLYADGVQSGSQGYNFGTLANGKNTSAWRFCSAAPMEREPYYHTNPAWFSEVHSADNEITHTITTAPGNWLPNIDSWMRFCIDGDFDIEYEYDSLSGSSGQSGVYLGTSNARYGGNPSYSYFYMRAWNGGNYEAFQGVNGSGGTLGNAGAIAATARMRVTRTAGVYQAYKWDAGDGGWVTVGPTFSNAVLDGPQFVWMGIYAASGYSCSVKFRNFTINAGTVLNTVSWYRESAGTHRGTRGDMPEELAVISTTNSLDLIDTDSDKLWMRFVRGTNNLFVQNSGNSIIRDISWSDGILIIAVGRDTAEAQEGELIVIDFTMNIARYHREVASGVTGGIYQTGQYMYEPGHIVERNSGRNWANDAAAWQIPDYRTRSVSAFHDAGYHYRAVGTVEGAAIFKWLRWNMHGIDADSDDWDLHRANSTEVTEIIRARFFNGELFYCDFDNLYSRDRTNGSTGWEDNIDGSFSAEYTKALPGSRNSNHLNQYEPVFYQPAATKYVFMPSFEGVYRIDWPSGSWELFYSGVGQGGTHEILPTGSVVNSLMIVNDGTYDLMVIGAGSGTESQIFVVKLIDNTLYGVSVPRLPTRTPVVVAAR